MGIIKESRLTVTIWVSFTIFLISTVVTIDRLDSQEETVNPAQTRYSITYLSRRMDRFSTEFFVYDDADAAGNHFSARGRFNSFNNQPQGGTTNTDDPPFGVVLLPYPMIFTVASPAPAWAPASIANNSIPGQFYPFEVITDGGLMVSTPISTVHALSCTDSFWDGIFQVTNMTSTDSDMVTFSIQNPNGSNSQVVAMPTMKNSEVISKVEKSSNLGVKSGIPS